MSLRYIGPVKISEHGNPTFTWAGDTASGRHRNASVGGTLEWQQATQLSELLVNTARYVTVGAHTGVLDVLWFDDNLLAPFSGFYILKQNSHGPVDAGWSVNGLTGPVPISFSAVFLGADRAPMTALSSRALGNDFGIIGEPLFAPPFCNEDASGATDGNVVPIGGRTILREYDETSPMVWP